MKNKLKRNRIQCKHCKEIIESKTDHDFKLCKCGAVGIDEGLNYPKRIFSSNPQEEHYELQVPGSKLIQNSMRTWYHSLNQIILSMNH